MRSVLLHGATASVAIVIAVACGSAAGDGSRAASDGGAGSTSSSSSGSTADNDGSAAGGIDLATFSARFCAAFSTCCPKYPDYRVDDERCRSAVATTTLGDGPAEMVSTKTLSFDGVKAEACVAALESAVKGETYCESTHLPVACAEVWQQKPGFAPGDACLVRFQCTPSVDGPVRCDGNVCHIFMAGKLGDACDGTAQNVHAPPPGLDGVRSVVCYLDDGLHCDPTTRKCAARGALETPCSGSFECIDGLICADGDGGYRCRSARLVGESCSGADVRCADTLICDAATAKCVERKPVGATCAGQECVTESVCKNGTCVLYPRDPMRYAAFCGEN